MSAPTKVVIREVVPSRIWTFSVPFFRFGFIPFGGRSTAVKLESGDVWLVASSPLTKETKEKLKDIGEIKYLIAIDNVHHLFIGDYAKEWPSAQVIGVKDLLEKRKDIKWTGAYGADPPDKTYGFESEIKARLFAGFVNQDVAFLHIPTKTLIEADLLFNLPANEQFAGSSPNGWLPPFFVKMLRPSSSFHKKFVTFVAKDKEAMSRDAKAVAAWDFDRIIPCHGDVIETGGKEAWLSAYSELLQG